MNLLLKWRWRKASHKFKISSSKKIKNKSIFSTKWKRAIHFLHKKSKRFPTKNYHHQKTSTKWPLSLYAYFKNVITKTLLPLTTFYTSVWHRPWWMHIIYFRKLMLYTCDNYITFYGEWYLDINNYIDSHQILRKQIK